NGIDPQSARARARRPVRVEAARQVVLDGEPREPHRQPDVVDGRHDDENRVRHGRRAARRDEPRRQERRRTAVVVRRGRREGARGAAEARCRLRRAVVAEERRAGVLHAAALRLHPRFRPQPRRPSSRAARRLSAPEQHCGAGRVRTVRRRKLKFTFEFVVSSSPPYIELHTASAFSFLQGASLPEALVDRAADVGYGTVALLDRDGVYGAPRFHKAAKAAGLRAIVGAELTLEAGEPGQAGRAPVPSVLPVLCESADGYKNLCQLITRMKLRAPKGEGALTIEDLDGRTRGLVALVGRAALDGRRYGVGGLLDRIVGVFGRAN